MKAKLLPLKGKYYGSNIEILHDDGSKSEIKVWINDNSCIPSIREIEFGGYKTVEAALEDGWVCDCHFESDVCYKACLKIVNSINK